VTSFDGAGVPLAMTFTRTTAGSAIAVSPSTPFIPDIGVQSRTRVQLITWGRNGPGQTGTLSALAGAVSYQTAYSKRFLVGTILASPTEGGNFDAQNAAIAAAYPNNWVDLNSAPTVDEMAIIGFVPDSYGAYSNGRTDAGDLALGRIPSGMRASAGTPSGTDYLHLNNLGYALWALRFYRAIQAKGWFPSLVAI
jgi:lysophospholipase L1-like esterase